MMAVPITTERTFSPGAPLRLFDHPGLDQYDVASDGRFLVITQALDDDGGEGPSVSIRVVEDWFEEFRERE